MTTNTPTWKLTPTSDCLHAVCWTYTGHYNGKMVGNLFVWFRNGGIYCYSLVPVHIWAAFCRSNSKGKAYNRLIKAQYASVCLFRPAEPRKTASVPVRLAAAEKRSLETGRKFGLHNRHRYAA